MTATEWQAVTEANEGSFTVDLPAGWNHDVRMLRFGTEQRRVVQAAAPDGTVQLFAHDPELPSYYEPASGMFVTPPLQQLAPYVNAEGYVSDYLRVRFGALPGFRVDGIRAEPEIAAQAMRRGTQQGINSLVTAVSARFGWDGFQALLIGSTASMGPLWIADVAVLLCTTGDVEQYRETLLRVCTSERTSPQWRAMQNQQFASTMAFNRQQDALRLNQLQNLHLQRMGDIAAAGAANTQLHEERMRTADAAHASFLDRLNQPFASDGGAGEPPGLDPQHSLINAIREEETVRTASGEDVQVDTGADRYFVDERNRRWVGASGSADANDFRAAGLNPDDYQEGQIRR